MIPSPMASSAAARSPSRISASPSQGRHRRRHRLRRFPLRACAPHPARVIAAPSPIAPGRAHPVRNEESSVYPPAASLSAPKVRQADPQPVPETQAHEPAAHPPKAGPVIAARSLSAEIAAPNHHSARRNPNRRPDLNNRHLARLGMKAGRRHTPPTVTWMISAPMRSMTCSPDQIAAPVTRPMTSPMTSRIPAPESPGKVPVVAAAAAVGAVEVVQEVGVLGAGVVGVVAIHQMDAPAVLRHTHRLERRFPREHFRCLWYTAGVHGRVGSPICKSYRARFEG